MKQIYLALMITLIPATGAFALINSGYIITKNGIRLTGQIGVLNQTDELSTVVFINDFGNVYTLQPELIAGFVFKQDTTLRAFESKINSEERRWVFMQVLAKGKGLNLYSIVTERGSGRRSGFEEEEPVARELRVQNYYLEAKGKLPVRVQKVGFRRQMRDLLQRRAPKLARKIGSKGYRYRDILQIIVEFNEKIGKSEVFI